MNRPTSLRTKIIFAGIACLVLLAFCLTLVTLFAVDARKRQIVDNARELVQILADELTTRTASLQASGRVADAESLRMNARFREMVGFVVSGKDGVLVSLRYDYGEQRYEYVINPKTDEDIRVELQTRDVSKATEAGHSIRFEGKPEAELVVRYVPEVLLSKVQNESRRITIQLAALAGVLILLLIATFVLVWNLFRRHIERERAHENLDRMAYVGTLASGLAHEIRNPLNAISLNLDVVSEEIAEPETGTVEQTRKVVKLLKSEVGRLNATLTNFLQFALPAPRRLEMTDVVAILNETAVLLGPQMRHGRIHYSFEGDRSCVTLADPSGLRQVFWNVMLNAIQALEDRDDRRIEARCYVDAGFCCVEIRDSGPGVPPERREQVFEVFHSGRRGGSGFGLPIARQIVERLGGTIRIDSLDAWGCAVHIQLPLRTGNSAAREANRLADA